jgi:hypothetical protein
LGASSAEIDQQRRETRSELDQTLGVLEHRAAAGARRYGLMAAGVAVGLIAVAAGVLVYRQRRQRTLVKQLHEVLFETVRDLPDEVTSRLRRRLPIKVVVTSRANEEGAASRWAGMAQKMAPAVVGPAAGAIFSRLRRTPPDVVASE